MDEMGRPASTARRDCRHGEQSVARFDGAWPPLPTAGRFRAAARSRWLTPEQLDVLPDLAWLIDGIVLEASLLVLSAQPKTGKTFLAHEWACCMATGEPWPAARPGRARSCTSARRGIAE